MSGMNAVEGATRSVMGQTRVHAAHSLRETPRKMHRGARFKGVDLPLPESHHGD